MTSVFAARRAAEEFAELVDGIRHDVADRYAGLTSVVTALTTAAPVTARPEFVSDLRTQLLAAAEVELAPAPVVAPAGRTTARPRRFGTAAAAALVVVSGTTGIAAAAQSALPGDGLYSVKRSIEAIATALNASDAGKGSDLLSQAENRLHEVSALRSSGGDEDQIRAALADFRESASHGAGLLFRSYESGGDSADIAQVRSFASTQSTELRSLAARAPRGLAHEFTESADLLDAMDTQAQALCAGCGGGLDSVGDASSASVLQALLAAPAAATLPVKARTTAKPTRVASAAPAPHQAPKLAAPSTSVTAPAPTASPSVPGTSATDPIKKTVSGVTSPLAKTIDQVGQTTGLTSATDPVTNLLDGLGK